jgi:hypothetical protein
VFYSGEVRAYFLTWKIKNRIPADLEIEEAIKKYGRYFEGGKLIRHAQQPPSSSEMKEEMDRV